MEDDIIWSTNANDYELLGGAFAKVYKAQCKINERIVAIKVLSLENAGTSLIDIWKEVLSMKLCKHSNVLRCHCCFCVEDRLWIVSPYMTKGSLLRILQYLRKSGRVEKDDGLEETIVAAVLKQSALGLQYLHASNLLHRDIKAGNILVDSTGRVCLADLGVARVMEGSMKQAHAHTFVGTPCWMAPEVMNHDKYNAAADIWSFGITALELYRGYPPYARYEAMEAIVRTCQGEPPSFSSYPDSTQVPSRAFRNWLAWLLQKDPLYRPSIDRILNHRFLLHIDEHFSQWNLAEFLKTIPDLDNDLITEEKSIINMTPSSPKWRYF